MTKKILCFLLAMSMAFSLALPASANSQDVPISVDIEAASISVTVPTNLPISVDSNGDSVTEVEAYIENHSAAQVEVKNIQLFGIEGWELKSWDTNWKSSAFGTKEFAMKLNGEEVPINGMADISSFSPINGDGRERFTYEGRIAPQANGGTATIGTVVFTIGWMQHEFIIPEGGTLYRATGDVLYAGEKFPKNLNATDVYSYGDYIYHLSAEGNAYGFSDLTEGKEFMKKVLTVELGVSSWEEAFSIYQELYEQENGESITEDMLWETAGFTPETFEPGIILGWRVELNEEVTDRNKERYSELTPYIAGYPLINLNYTFENCVNLKEIPVIPSTVTSMEYTFEGCSSLEDVSDFVVPHGVTKLRNTFRNCTSLTSVFTIPNTVKSIEGLFEGCSSLVDIPAIPYGVTNISAAFDGTAVTDLSKYIIPNSVETMMWTFQDCKSLISAPVIPESVSNLASTFYGCTSLTGTVTINTNKIDRLYGTAINSGWNTSPSDVGPCGYCFNDVDMSKITLAGDASKEVLNLIGSTGDNWTPIQ